MHVLHNYALLRQDEAVGVGRAAKTGGQSVSWWKGGKGWRLVQAASFTMDGP